jgi:hypothetical protein
LISTLVIHYQQSTQIRIDHAHHHHYPAHSCTPEPTSTPTQKQHPDFLKSSLLAHREHEWNTSAPHSHPTSILPAIYPFYTIKVLPHSARHSCLPTPPVGPLIPLNLFETPSDRWHNLCETCHAVTLWSGLCQHSSPHVERQTIKVTFFV